MLCWREFAGWGRQRVAVVFDCEGGQYIIHGCPQPVATYSTHDAQPEIFDTLLIIIFRMGQCPCVNYYSHLGLPVRWLCITSTKLIFYYLTYKTQTHWRSVDTHFQVTVTMSSIAFLPIQVANNVFMNNNEQITF